MTRWGKKQQTGWFGLVGSQRFTALQSGEVDVLSRNTTWTLTREARPRPAVRAVTFYDGQGFMVKEARREERQGALSGATVCVQPGTTTELNLADYFRANKMS
jgi:general L-amino acid transport system substrate-binding protein